MVVIFHINVALAALIHVGATMSRRNTFAPVTTLHAHSPAYLLICFYSAPRSTHRHTICNKFVLSWKNKNNCTHKVVEKARYFDSYVPRLVFTMGVGVDVAGGVARAHVTGNSDPGGVVMVWLSGDDDGSGASGMFGYSDMLNKL